MEIAGDPVPVVQKADEARPLLQPRVLDGDARRLRQRLRHGLVLFVEGFTVQFVGQVQVPVDLSTHPQGYAQERIHRWMMGREPIAVGVGVQIGQPERLGIGNENTEYAASCRAGTDALLLFVGQPDGQELVEGGPGRIEDSESAIAGLDQRTGFGDEMPQEFGQVDIGRDHEHRRHESPQLLRVVDPVVRHSCERTHRAGRMARQPASGLARPGTGRMVP